MAKRVPLIIGGKVTEALVALPKSAAPGVVFTHYKNGLDAFTEAMVDRLAADGYAAIAPNHFHVLPPGVGPEQRRDYLSDEQMAADMAAAAHWLRDQPSVVGDRFGVMGPCAGGRQTLLALTWNPELWACGSAWYGGSAFKPQGSGHPAPASRERLARIAAPLEGYFGNLDKNPSPADVDKLDALLTELGKPHAFYRYDGADHGFLNGVTDDHGA